MQQGREDLLQAGRGEVQHLLSAGCLQQRPRYHRPTGERPLPDSGDSRTPRAALPISPAAIAQHPEDRVAGELYPARRTSRARRRGLIGRHDRVATLDCTAGKRTTIISAPAGSGKTSLLHGVTDRSGQDPDHNHQDPVTTVHPPGGELGSVAKARAAARGRASDLAHDSPSPMTSGRQRTARRRTPLNAAAFTGRTEIVMSEARSAESRCRWRR